MGRRGRVVVQTANVQLGVFERDYEVHGTDFGQMESRRLRRGDISQDFTSVE